ncbi:integrase [Kitasatospora sp. MAP12-15]|nr:integrase [Kitasatospora sp. MAP12-44]
MGESEIVNAELLPVAEGSREGGLDSRVIYGSDNPDRQLSPETVAALAESIPENTRREYERWWARCAQWCEENNRTFLPMTPETLTEWVRVMTETVSEKTGEVYGGTYISGGVAAIRSLHTLKGYDGQPGTKTARMLLKAHIKRLRDAGRRVKKSAVVELDELAAMVEQCDPATLTGLRDRLILIWSVWAFTRRSELTARTLPDATVTKEGLDLYFSSSKTDQAAKGETVTMPRRGDLLDPVTAWRDYRDAFALHGVTSGRILRKIDRWGNISDELSPQSVNLIVQKIAAAAGVDYDENGLRLTAHGLRATGAGLADENGATPGEIRKQGRWREKSIVADGYIRRKGANALTNVPLVAPRAAPDIPTEGGLVEVRIPTQSAGRLAVPMQ